MVGDIKQAAQKMLDMYGWFVINATCPMAIGVTTLPVCAVNHDESGEIEAGVMVIGPATEDDYLKQCELTGTHPGWSGYRYRAVAE